MNKGNEQREGRSGETGEGRQVSQEIQVRFLLVALGEPHLTPSVDALSLR